MSAYIFASVEITDPAAYEEYRRRPLLAIRQRAARSNLLAIEGV
jgi:uncharacterized protein (DUF1330 family)